MTNVYNSQEIIADRYQIINILGQGGIATTYRALDTQTNTEVAIKTISLKGIGDWKQIELFEREAKTLQQLDYPGIPQYLDYFEIDTTENRYFYLVQQLAPGKSLYDLIMDGWCPNEIEVKNIASSILKILIYLQQLSPPIIHRDIKPQNIIYQENGAIFLVDFGAVADVYQHTFNSTVVGTFGYMAPEQFRGKATLATDIYGLGTTLLFLLTKKCPAELPQHGLKINFRPCVKLEEHFVSWLEKSITPNTNQRFYDANDALAALEKRFNFKPVKTIEQPASSLVKLIEKPDKLVILVPPIKRLRVIHTYLWLIANLPCFFYGILSIVLISIIFVSEIGMLFWVIFLSIITGLFPFLVLCLLVVTLSILKYWFYRRKIVIPRYKSYGDKNRNNKQIAIPNFPIRAETRKYQLPLTNEYITHCCLIRNIKPLNFGFLLTRHENEWLVQEINSFLARASCSQNSKN